MEDKKILRPVQAAPGAPDFVFFCPGCKEGHGIWTTKRNGMNAIWTFNGDMEKPTFSPSLLIKTPWWEPPVNDENYEEWKRNPWPQKQVMRICHSFIRNGQIQFLNDCTHHLAGKTVDLPEF